MRARTASAAAILAALAAAAPAAAARPRCGDGTTMFVQGPLRIFGVPNDGAGEVGFDHWGCLRPSRTPRETGWESSTGGTGSHSTPRYAFDGRRWLASLELSDGEGGPDINYYVTDLRTGRVVVSARGGLYPGGPVRVTSHGDLVQGEEHAISFYPRGRPRAARFLSNPDDVAIDPAVAGNVVYWTVVTPGAAPAAQSDVLPGVAPGPEDVVLQPVEVRTRRDACARRRGSTVAASPSVRVVSAIARDGTRARFVCRIGGRHVLRLDRAGAPRSTGRSLRIAGDRWLLAREHVPRGGLLRVVDCVSGTVVTRVPAAGPIHGTTLLHDGTVAWIAPGGALLAQAPAASGPTELAPAEAGAGALASSPRTVYWTAGGAPHRWRRP